MKISKLFHWLYAFLMLSPCLAILFTCLYVSFNPNAKDSYYGETINDSQQVQIDKQYLKVGDFYTLTLSPVPFTDNIDFQNINVENLVINGVPNDDVNTIRFLSWNNSYYAQFLIEGVNSTEVNITNNNLTCYFKFMGFSRAELSSMFNNFYQVVYNKDSFLSDSFYYSVNRITDSFLFSWASTSFLASPILYITNLFGMPASSPIIVLLSYWLSISIIWLVFDLIMYVPLLAHRWLDKGVLE